MIEFIVGIVLLSFILAVLSLRDYKGIKPVDRITEELRKERIKGTIILPRDGSRHGTHYSS